MKKYGAFFLALALLLSLVLSACSNVQPQAPTTDPSFAPSQPSSVAPTESVPTEPTPPQDFQAYGITIPMTTFPAGTELAATPLAQDSAAVVALKAAVPDAGQIFAYEITAMCDGTIAQPSEAVNVTIQLPEGYLSQQHIAELYYISPEGLVEQLPITLTETQIQVTLSHFSSYAVVLKAQGFTAYELRQLARRLISTDMATYDQVLFTQNYSQVKPEKIVEFLVRWCDLPEYKEDIITDIGYGPFISGQIFRLPLEVLQQLGQDVFGCDYAFTSLPESGDDYSPRYDKANNQVLLTLGSGFGGGDKGFEYNDKFVLDGNTVTFTLDYVTFNYEGGENTLLYTAEVRLMRLDNGVWKILSAQKNN